MIVSESKIHIHTYIHTYNLWVVYYIQHHRTCVSASVMLPHCALLPLPLPPLDDAPPLDPPPGENMALRTKGPLKDPDLLWSENSCAPSLHGFEDSKNRLEYVCMYVCMCR